MPARKLVLVLALTVFGVWGCNKGAQTASNDRFRQLETQVAKLSDDLKVAAAAQETLAAKLQQMEAGRKAAERERDDLSARLKDRTAQLETLRTDLKQLLGRTESALLDTRGGVPATPVSLQK